MEQTFPIANVTFIDGVLIIDSTAVSCEGKHYNVHVETNENNSRIIVKGEKPDWGLSLSKGDFKLDDIMETSIEEYRPLLFFGPVKRRSKNIVEFKERTKRVYHSDKWTIIQENNPYL